MRNISFIGLGAMGTPMALNLIKNKYNLFLYDINTKNYKHFSNSNAKICNNYNDLSINSNIFISMLPDGKALSNLVLGKNGIINCIKKQSVFIDCSSVDYKTTIRVSNEFKKKGIKFLDAPVSGGVSGAKNASLTIMVGGNRNSYKHVARIFNALGKNIIYVGKSGSGQIVKACNNMMLGINMIGVSEAFTLASHYGINSKIFFDIVSKSTGSSWAMLNHLPIKGIVKTSAANNQYKPGYSAKLILKDLSIARDMAKKVSLKALMGSKAFEIYASFCKKNKSNLDYSAIVQSLFKFRK